MFLFSTFLFLPFSFSFFFFFFLFFLAPSSRSSFPFALDRSVGSRRGGSLLLSFKLHYVRLDAGGISLSRCCCKVYTLGEGKFPRKGAGLWVNGFYS